MCFEGISTQDTYRFEVYSTYEYIPTMSFEAWTDVRPSRVDNDGQATLKDLISDNVFNAVSGIVSKSLIGDVLSIGSIAKDIKSIVLA